MLTLPQRSIFNVKLAQRARSLLIQAVHFTGRVATDFVAAFLLLACVTVPAQAEQFSVTVVLSENSGPYLEFSNALRESLLKKNITPVVIENSGRPFANSDLVIGVGMKAATAIAASNAPAVLNVLIPKSGHEKLLRDFPRRTNSKTYTTIFLDQPLGRQASLIAAALPDKRRVGVLHSATPSELSGIRREMAKHKLNLHEQTISQALPLHDALNELLKKSEVLLALPDPEIYNSSTIRNILLATYRSGVPLIGFSAAYVKAGALCAVYSTPEQFAVQADILIRKFSETQIFPAAQYPHAFEVAVNEQVARSLGLRIRSATELHDETEAFEGDEP